MGEKYVTYFYDDVDPDTLTFNKYYLTGPATYCYGVTEDGVRRLLEYKMAPKKWHWRDRSKYNSDGSLKDG